MDDDYKTSFFDSLGMFQSICFVLFSLIVVVAAISILRCSSKRDQICIALAIFGVGIFFYSGALEHLSLTRHHWSNTISGGSDPVALDRALAQFYTKLHAFRSLSVAALMISAFGYAIAALGGRANKPEISSPITPRVD